MFWQKFEKELIEDEFCLLDFLEAKPYFSQIIRNSKKSKIEEDTFSFIESCPDENKIFAQSASFYQNVLPNNFVESLFVDEYEYVTLPGSNITYIYEPGHFLSGKVNPPKCIQLQNVTLSGKFIICGKKLEHGFQGLRTFELFEFLMSIQGTNGYPEIQVKCLLQGSILRG
ncbi:MAG: hypothetical protein HC836_11215 [Richelia sp. RM2_1_2]|nr:hypothetical protein [Richelia sp. RM1_1_1]NJO58882.1 hypothetical protein [Richelia sp. RM2_1_2]